MTPYHREGTTINKLMKGLLDFTNNSTILETNQCSTAHHSNSGHSSDMSSRSLNALNKQFLKEMKVCEIFSTLCYEYSLEI